MVMTDALGTAGLQRGLLSDQIYALIKAMIKDSTLAPGEQLVESQLARQMQVSQAPVRDALKRLAHEGLVSHVRHQGNFVASYSAEEAAQAKVARVELEGLAGRLACGALDPARRAELVGLIAQMHEAAEAEDLARFRELDFTFHRAVIEASGNVYLPACGTSWSRACASCTCSATPPSRGLARGRGLAQGPARHAGRR